MAREKYEKQDEQLYYHIRRLQQGYVDSYTEIYNLSSKYLYKIIFDVVGDYHTTEDMLQETFIKIYNNIGSLQSPEAYYMWAGRIATNLSVRYIYKYRKELLTTASDDGEGNEEFIFDTVVDDNEMFIPESVLDNKEHQRMIGEVIDSLSVEQKLAVQCFYFEEMSVREIAQLMECSEGTIKSRLNYARKAIKDSVLHIEKTQGTKLYSFGVIPILLILYKGFAGATVSSAAVASVGNSLAGMSGTSGSVAGAGNVVGAGNPTGMTGMANAGNVVGATTTAATTTTATTVAAGMSAKLAIVIATCTIGTGALFGGTMWSVKTISDAKKIQIEESTGKVQGDTEKEKEDIVDVNISVVPTDAQYIVSATGEIIEEGEEMPKKPKDGDCVCYGDYKYTYDSEKYGWIVELNGIEDYETRTEFGVIMETIAGENIADMSYTFNGCKGMIEAPAIPADVAYVEGIFANCESLKKAPELPSNITDISMAFMGCKSLTEVPEIPSGVMGMMAAFMYCESLTEAPEIPSNVWYMRYAFYGCTSLKTAPVIPNSVWDISFLFGKCTSLTGNVKFECGLKESASMKLKYEGCFSGVNITSQGIKIKGDTSLARVLKETTKDKSSMDK